MSGSKILVQSSVGATSYSVASEASPVIELAEEYTSLFDAVWMFGISGGDTVQIVAFAVLCGTAVNVSLDIIGKWKKVFGDD